MVTDSLSDSEQYKWWKDKQFVAELDQVYNAMESGKDSGITLEELEISIEELKMKRYSAKDKPH